MPCASCCAAEGRGSRLRFMVRSLVPVVTYRVTSGKDFVFFPKVLNCINVLHLFQKRPQCPPAQAGERINSTNEWLVAVAQSVNATPQHSQSTVHCSIRQCPYPQSHAMVRPEPSRNQKVACLFEQLNQHIYLHKINRSPAVPKHGLQFHLTPSKHAPHIHNHMVWKLPGSACTPVHSIQSRP